MSKWGLSKYCLLYTSVAGKAVKLENVTDKQGFHATMYIRFNPEKGRPYRYDTNPCLLYTSRCV